MDLKYSCSVLARFLWSNWLRANKKFKNPEQAEVMPKPLFWGIFKFVLRLLPLGAILWICITIDPMNELSIRNSAKEIK